MILAFKDTAIDLRKRMSDPRDLRKFSLSDFDCFLKAPSSNKMLRAPFLRNEAVSSGTRSSTHSSRALRTSSLIRARGRTSHSTTVRRNPPEDSLTFHLILYMI
jgi:hypothetical protein